MCALGLDLNVGAPAVFTGGGTPSLNLVLTTQLGAFLQTEDGFFLEFEL
tara:strand:- start:448 stop:594 length:147 start_codon:yes stop_codon:yes gene_type:complete